MAQPTSYDTLFAQLGVSLEVEFVELALTHRSFAYESGGIPTNERLEFLGDAVLGVVVAHELYQRHPDYSEGQLAKMRSAVVNARALAGVARELSLGTFLKLGKGEETTGGRDKSSILSDTLEAIIGAIYLEHGMAVAHDVVLHLFTDLLDYSASLGAGLDWKTSLQELVAQRGLGVPSYVVEQSGPEHAKEFQAHVVLGERTFAAGRGSNKKEAEQQAASNAYTAIDTEVEAPALDADTVEFGQ